MTGDRRRRAELRADLTAAHVVGREPVLAFLHEDGISVLIRAGTGPSPATPPPSLRVRAVEAYDPNDDPAEAADGVWTKG